MVTLSKEEQARLDAFNAEFPETGAVAEVGSAPVLDPDVQRRLDAFNAEFPEEVSPLPSGGTSVPTQDFSQGDIDSIADEDLLAYVQRFSDAPPTDVAAQRQAAGETRLGEIGDAAKRLLFPYPDRPGEQRFTAEGGPGGFRDILTGYQGVEEIAGGLLGPFVAAAGAGQIDPLEQRVIGGITGAESGAPPPEFIPEQVAQGIENISGGRPVAESLGEHLAQPEGIRMGTEFLTSPFNLPIGGGFAAIGRLIAKGGRALKAPTTAIRASRGVGRFEPSLIVVDDAHPTGQRLVFKSERDLRRGSLELGQQDVTVLPADATPWDIEQAAARLPGGPPPVTIRGITRGPAQRQAPQANLKDITSAEKKIGVLQRKIQTLTESLPPANTPSGIRERRRIGQQIGGFQQEIDNLRVSIGEAPQSVTGDIEDIDMIRRSIRRRESELDRLRREVPKKASPDSPINKKIRAKEAQLEVLRNNFSDLQGPEDIGLEVSGVIRQEAAGLGRKGIGDEPVRGTFESKGVSDFYAADTPAKMGNLKATIREEGIETAVDELDSLSKLDEAKAVYTKLDNPPGEPPVRTPGVPMGAGMTGPRRSVEALISDMDLPSWEAPAQGVMRKWEAARGAEGADTVAWFEEGESLTKRLGIVSFDEDMMDPVFKVLHGEAPIESLPDSLQEFARYVKGMQQLEEKEMLEFLQASQATSPNFLQIDAANFASKMMAHPDYFPRGWSQGEAIAGVGRRPLGLGRLPRYTKARVDASYSELRQAGLTPRSWNPLAMMAERRVHGIEYRENVVMMNRLYKEGLAKSAGTTPEFDMTEKALKGWRVPDIGPLFTGRSVTDEAGQTALQSPTYVPNYVANILEQVYHPPLTGTMQRVRWFTNGLKGVKLAGSLFQHVDILQRAIGSGATPTGLKRAAPLRYPSLLKDVFTTQFSPRSRSGLRNKMLSNDRVNKDFGLTYRMLVEEGLNLQADTSIIQREMVDFLDTTPKRILPAQKLKQLNDWWQSGLFQGVYLSAQKWSLENFIIPQVRRTRPGATPRQVAAEAAEAANLIFSTPGRWQSMITDPTMRKYMENFFFSINENESLLRLGARAVSTNPRAGLAREQVLGTLTAMVAISNGINYAATGEPLPWKAYNPVNFADSYAFFGFDYANKFLSPQFPGLTGSAGQPIHIDIMGQMDTPFRVADPFGFISARLNVPYRVVADQIVGETFHGEKLDTIPKRAFHLAQSLGGPIGGTSAMGALIERFPAVQEYVPRGEVRLGFAGQMAQLTGINFRSATTDEAIKGYYPNFDKLPEANPAGVEGLSKASLRNRMSKVLKGTVQSDPYFPGLVFKEDRAEFVQKQASERQMELWRQITEGMR